MFKSVIVHSVQELEKFAGSFATFLGPKPNDFIMLSGPIGIGKTCFARGFIQTALNNDKVKVLSPTFLLEQSYIQKNSGLVIHHFDLYRFEPKMTKIDSQTLDWENSVKNGVCLVEWPERISDLELLPSSWIHVYIELGRDQQERVINIHKKNKVYHEISN